MPSEQIRSISYLKAHASEAVSLLAEGGPALFITQNGKATAVLQDIATYQATQETLALLKILALGDEQIKAGAVVPAAEAFRRARARIGAARAL